MLYLCATRLPEICVNVRLNIFPLLAFIEYVDLFHSLIFLCENEYVLISNTQCSFINVTSCALVLTFLKRTKYFY